MEAKHPFDGGDTDEYFKSKQEGIRRAKKRVAAQMRAQIEKDRAKTFDAKFYDFDPERNILVRKKFRPMGWIKFRFFQVLTWIVQAGDAIACAWDWVYQSWKGTLPRKRYLDWWAIAHLESHLIISPLLMVYWNYEDEVNYYVWLYYKFICKFTYYEIITPFVKLFLKSKCIAFFLLLS